MPLLLLCLGVYFLLVSKFMSIAAISARVAEPAGFRRPQPSPFRMPESVAHYMAFFA